MSLKMIKKAKERIEHNVKKTPLIHSDIFSKIYDNDVYLKCENLQITGAYKIRGALNKIYSLNKSEKLKGVVCSSAGNHAQGVAYASSLVGVNSIIVMPKTTPYIKVEATRKLTPNIVLYGECYDDAYNEAKRIEKDEGAFFIHPFDDIDIIYGQGTIALEILEEIENIDIVICPIGGGGLISGLSLALKEVKPNIQIIGVQAENANAMKLSYDLDEYTEISTVNTIADGIAVKKPGKKTFNIIRENVDKIVTVSDKEIVDSFLILSEKQKLIAEPAGLVSVAALSKLNVTNKRIICILSGGNIDMLTMSTLINNGLIEGRRLYCFNVELPNLPGELLKISKVLSCVGANIIKIDHDKFKASNQLRNVLVEITLETNGENHINNIIKSLEEANYFIQSLY